MLTNIEKQKTGERKSIAAGAVTYLLLLAACIALIRPFLNAGISDDFGYIQSAKDFADTGRIIYHGAATPMLGWLLPFGALFIKLFGFSFTAARVAAFVITAANGILLQSILLRLGCRRVLALFGATAVMLSPASLPESVLFFTDGPGLLAMLVTLALCMRIVRADTPRATQFWIVAAFAASFFLGTVRQLLWLDTLVMVPSAIWLVRKRKGILPWAGIWFVLAVIGIAGMMHWWNLQPYALHEALIPHYPLSAWARYLIVPEMELLILLAPVLSMFLLRPVSKRVYIVSGVLALLAPAAIIRNPYDVLRVSSQAIFGDAPQWVFLLALAYTFAVIPIALKAMSETLAEHRHQKSRVYLDLYQLAILLGPFSLAVALLVISRGTFWLRYWLDVICAVTIWLVKLWSVHTNPRRNLALAAPVLVAAYCAFSVIMTHDLFRTTAAYLSLTQWYVAHGMPRDQMDAGYSLDGWYEIQRTGHLNDERISVPANTYHNHDLPPDIRQCHDFFLFATPSIHPIYGVGETMTPCFEPPPMHSVNYTTWMAPHHRTAFIARYTPKYAIPVR